MAEVDDDGIAGLRVSGAASRGTLSGLLLGRATATAGNAEAEAINAVVWLGTSRAQAAALRGRGPLL